VIAPFSQTLCGCYLHFILNTLLSSKILFTNQNGLLTLAVLFNFLV